MNIRNSTETIVANEILLPTVEEETKTAITNAILRSIQIMAANILGRVSVTWDEVEDIYASGKYPEINANIDYIISGKKFQRGA